MKTFTSDGLLYAYKTYKVIKLYWHVSFYNNIIIVIYIYKLACQYLILYN